MAHASREALAQRQSSTIRGEKAPDQNVVRMAAETEGSAHSVQILAIDSRNIEGVRLKGLKRERRSLAASAGPYGLSASNDRRQRVARPAPPRLRTFQ